MSISWQAFEDGDVIETAALVVVLCLAGLYLAGPRNGRLPVYGALALLIFVPIHIAHNYRGFVIPGQSGGIQFRYYLPFWPVVALGASLALSMIPERIRWALIAVAIAALLYSSAPVAVLRFVF
jgi:hypothetical protein